MIERLETPELEGSENFEGEDIKVSSSSSFETILASLQWLSFEIAAHLVPNVVSGTPIVEPL